jgi:hypothetical protein
MHTASTEVPHAMHPELNSCFTKIINDPTEKRPWIQKFGDRMCGAQCSRLQNKGNMRTHGALKLEIPNLQNEFINSKTSISY